MAKLTNKQILFYVSGLSKRVCFCGKVKKRGKSLCYDCFSALPSDMQRDLYKSLYSGYPEAYDAAVEWLKTWEL